jgi:pyridoxal phosphate enzyme (YggS family)
VCIQVNISQEPQKQGVLPKETLDLAKKIATIPNLRLRGLMAIPKISTSFEEASILFRPLKELQESLKQAGFSLDTLSMGMSHDLEAAIMEGATLIRVGTAIFGQRPLSNKDTQ